MTTSNEAWGEHIEVNTVRGIPLRMYSQRPRRVENLLSFADRWCTRPHIVQGERILTFEGLQHASVAKGRALLDLGVKAQDRVFLLGWNSPEWIANLWGILHIGAVPVLTNGWWSEIELAQALEALRPTLTLADTHGAKKLPANARRGPWEISTGAKDSNAANTARLRPDTQQHEEDPAVIIFTSGTEGRPKAVVLSHRALLAGLHMLLHVTRRLPHQIDEFAGDIGLHTGPLFHVGGVQTLLRAVTVGSTLVMPESKFDPAEAMALIERHKVGRWAAVPTMVSRLLDHPDVHRRDLSSLRSLTIGGAPVHAELLKRIRDGLPSVQPRIPTGYGLTENGGQATATSGANPGEKPGSSGKPLPCVEIRLQAHEGLPDGEILIRAPTQMSGYYGLEASPIDEDGWLRTGDLGRFDEQGNLWITGRCKDMIIRGGENIAPVAVERALVAIPGVSEAVVFGVPHADLGEEVMAVVVVENDLTSQQLQDTLRGTLASYAVPSRWKVQREPLPLNHAGKVDKPALAAEARNPLAV